MLGIISNITLLRSGGNYHHGMFRNPTAAVNLFHVGKQYLTFCQAKASVTRNLIGGKIISNVKRNDTRNSLHTVAFVDWTKNILNVIRCSHKRLNAHSTSEYYRSTLRQTTGVRYTCLERHLTF